MPRCPGVLERGASVASAISGCTRRSSRSLHSTLLTEAQYTVAKALDALQERSPANGRVRSPGPSPPPSGAGRQGRSGAGDPRSLHRPGAPGRSCRGRVHWHECAEVMARLDQDFDLGPPTSRRGAARSPDAGGDPWAIRRGKHANRAGRRPDGLLPTGCL